ncbi:MAG TPA: YkgJ family cysteine cluster protein [Polyangiaceae bacterium]|jgi:Fe-S-cluster containining protein|nr:YkgJ family cysteine cluster protein [Polyangiaceae bacterium]
MDGEPKKEALRGLYRAELDAARAVFAEVRDRNTALKLAMGTAQRAQRIFLPVMGAVDCRAGCSFCCHGVRVDVTAAEALTIARGFREALTAEQLDVIRARVRRHAETIRGMTLTERHRARTPCSLLDESSGLCAVHDARPMRCRAHHSVNVADCEAMSLRPDEDLRIKRYPDVLDAHEAMIVAQKDAVDAAGVDARPFELSLALDVALSHDDAAERWARGERIFDAAVFTWDDDA